MTEAFKKAAAHAAVEFIEPGMVVGLGTGSTAAYALQEIAHRFGRGELEGIVGVPTGLEVERKASDLGIPLGALDDHFQVDLTVDGADEVDPELELIKGGGGALLREKIVAQASRREIIVVDETKLSERLGSVFALPIEVLPFGWKPEAQFVESLGADPKLRRSNDGEVFETDQGNWILDANFGPIEDPAALAQELNSRAGVVAHGLFLGLATDVMVAGENGVRHLARKSQLRG